MKLKTKLCSSLAQVLPSTAPSGAEIRSVCALQGEIFSSQFAYCAEDFHSCPIRVSEDSPLRDFITCRSVELVPVDYSVRVSDDDCLATVPGLYLDRRAAFPQNGNKAIFSQWHTLWLKVAVPEEYPAGKNDIVVSIHASPLIKMDRSITAKRTFTLEVLPLRLSEQTLTVTNWPHTDCIASHYQCRIFSEEHRQLLEDFFPKCLGSRHQFAFYVPLHSAAGYRDRLGKTHLPTGSRF